MIVTIILIKPHILESLVLQQLFSPPDVGVNGDMPGSALDVSPMLREDAAAGEPIGVLHVGLGFIGKRPPEEQSQCIGAAGAPAGDADVGVIVVSLQERISVVGMRRTYPYAGSRLRGELPPG